MAPRDMIARVALGTYREFSEEIYRAGFMSDPKGHGRDYQEWLQTFFRRDLEDYEVEGLIDILGMFAEVFVRNAGLQHAIDMMNAMGIAQPVQDGSDMVTFIFACPYCGEPHARPKDAEIDIHSGATYECPECGGDVTFEAMTTDQYVAFCEWDRKRRMGDTPLDDVQKAHLELVLSKQATCDHLWHHAMRDTGKGYREPILKENGEPLTYCPKCGVYRHEV